MPRSPPPHRLHGRIAIANAERAYARYLKRFSGARWERLEALGAKPQRPLWASTGTKNPDYSDVLYVERLIAPGVINTMPDATLRAFRDHGRSCRPSTPTPVKPSAFWPRPQTLGSTSTRSPTELEREGVESFCASYRELLGCIETKLAAISGHAAIPA